MQTIIQTIAAGALLTLNQTARYFRILDAGAPVTVYFYRKGAEVGRAEAVGAGFWMEEAPGDSFDRIAISSEVTQFLKLLLTHGRGGYDVQAIADTGAASVALTADYLAAIRATMALMYPTMSADELDVAMLFVQGGYTSQQQAIFAAVADAQMSAANIRAAITPAAIFY